MKIQEFKDIPLFLQRYLEYYEPGLNCMVHDFCKILLELDYDVIEDVTGDCYLFKTDNYTVKRLSEFYLRKSKLDLKLNCPYEEELNLPKSVMYEVFAVSLEDKFVSLYIESYEEGLLILKAL